MNKQRYDSLCMMAEQGRDAFVTHPASGEEGLVTDCVAQTRHMIVETPEGEKRCWDYQECEELRHEKSGPMI